MNDLKRLPSQEKPWLKFFSEEAINATLPKKTIYSYMREKNEGFEKNTAINFFGNKISYGEFLGTVDSCAASFAALGVGKGDVVACCSATIPEMAIALYGLNKLGASMLTLDPRRSVPEIGSFLSAARVKVLLLLDLAFEHTAKLVSELDFIGTVVIISVDNYMPFLVRKLKALTMPPPSIPYSERIIDWKRFLRIGAGRTTETAEYGENELAAITLTGGTTGAPKGVMISNDGFNSIAEDFRYCGVEYTRDQRFMDIIPAFSSYGIVASLHMPLSLGLELVMIPKFDPNKVGYYIKKYRPAHTLLVPAHYEKLMNSREMAKGFDLGFFRTAGSGGDTMNEGLEAKLNGFLSEHGCKYPLSQGYGMSEASSAVSCCCNGNFRSLSVGYPLLTTTVGIFRPGTTEELGYGEEGEICITGPSVMLGYFNNEEETRKVLLEHPDGSTWIHSGDLGSIDEDGYLFIKGRIKRMITRADGHKIFPVALEGIIGRHRDVLSCAVVGVRDRLHAQGMQALAVIQLRPDADTEMVRAELFAMLEYEAEERGRPQFMEFVGEMPRAGMGKIDYKKLADDFEKTRTA